MPDDRSFASASLPRHLIRGAIGFGALIGSVALIGMFGLGSLLLAPVGLLALRGCPTCWAIGLMQTLSMGRLRRSCVDGRCELTVAGRARPQAGTLAPDGPRQTVDESATFSARKMTIAEPDTANILGEVLSEIAKRPGVVLCDIKSVPSARPSSTHGC